MCFNNKTATTMKKQGKTQLGPFGLKQNFILTQSALLGFRFLIVCYINSLAHRKSVAQD